MQTYEQALARVKEARTRGQKYLSLCVSQTDWERLWEAIPNKFHRGWGWCVSVFPTDDPEMLDVDLTYATDDVGAFDFDDDGDEGEEP